MSQPYVLQDEIREPGNDARNKLADISDRLNQLQDNVKNGLNPDARGNNETKNPDKNKGNDKLRTMLNITEASGKYRTSITLNAYLYAEQEGSSPPIYDQPISGMPVEFYVLVPWDEVEEAPEGYKAWQLFGIATTDQEGKASLTFYADVDAKRYKTRAEFQGTTDYHKTKSHVNHYGLTIERLDTTTIVYNQTGLLTDASVNFTDQLEFEVHIFDEFNIGVDQGSMFFQIKDGRDVLFEDVYNVNLGYVDINYSADLKPGAYNMIFAYSGNENYTYSSSVHAIEIGIEDTTLLGEGIFLNEPIQTEYGKEEILSFRLIDDEGHRLADQEINATIVSSTTNEPVVELIGVTSSLGYVHFTQVMAFDPGMYDIIISYSNTTFFVSQTLNNQVNISKAELTFSNQSELHVQYTDPAEFDASIETTDGYILENVNSTLELYYHNDTELVLLNSMETINDYQVYFISSDTLFYGGNYTLEVRIPGTIYYDEIVLTITKEIEDEQISVDNNQDFYQVTYGEQLYVYGSVTDDDGEIPISYPFNARYVNETGSYEIGDGFVYPNGTLILSLNSTFSSPDDVYNIEIYSTDIEGYSFASTNIDVLIENTLFINSDTSLIEADYNGSFNFDVDVSDFFNISEVGSGSAYIFYNSTTYHLQDSVISNGILDFNIDLNSTFIPGTYDLILSVSSNNITITKSDVIDLSINKLDTNIEITNQLSFDYKSDLNLTATLATSPYLDPLNNSKLDYYMKINGEWLKIKTSKTNATGFSRVNVNQNATFGYYLDIGTYEYQIAFNTSSLYRSASLSGLIQITPISTNLSIDYDTPRFNDLNLRLRLTLTDNLQRPLEDYFIKFQFSALNIESWSGMSTDGNGDLLLDIPLSTDTQQLDVGEYGFTLIFQDADGNYKSLEQSHTFELKEELIDLTYVLDASGDSVSFTVLKDNPSTTQDEKITDLTVDISIQLRSWITELQLDGIITNLNGYIEDLVGNDLGLIQDDPEFEFNPDYCNIDFPAVFNSLSVSEINGNDVTFEADVSDPEGISSVEFKIDLPTIDFDYDPMSPVSGNYQYTYSFPFYFDPAGEDIPVLIKVIDNDGNEYIFSSTIFIEDTQTELIDDTPGAVTGFTSEKTGSEITDSVIYDWNAVEGATNYWLVKYPGNARSTTDYEILADVTGLTATQGISYVNNVMVGIVAVNGDDHLALDDSSIPTIRRDYLGIVGGGGSGPHSVDEEYTNVYALNDHYTIKQTPIEMVSPSDCVSIPYYYGIDNSGLEGEVARKLGLSSEDLQLEYDSSVVEIGEMSDIVNQISLDMYDNIFDAIQSASGVNIGNLIGLVDWLHNDGPTSITNMLRTQLSSLTSLYHMAQIDFNSYDWESIWSTFEFRDIDEWVNIDQYYDDFVATNADEENYNDFAVWNLFGEGTTETINGDLNLYNEYMGKKWLIPVFYFFDFVMTSVDSNYDKDSTAVTSKIESILSQMIEFAVKIVDIDEIIYQSYLNQQFYNTTKNSILEGFATTLSYAVSDFTDEYSTNNQGIINIDIKDYVVNSIDLFFADYTTNVNQLEANYPNDDIDRNKLDLVKDYFDYILSQEGTLYNFISETSGWIYSFSDFVFNFDFTNSNYAGYVDAQYGYEMFEVSGISSRRYINPTYLNPDEHIWDIDQEFYLNVPKEALETFGFEFISELDEISLSQGDHTLQGTLIAPNYLDKIVKIYKKIGENYRLVRTIDIDKDSTQSFGENIGALPVTGRETQFRGLIYYDKFDYYSTFRNDVVDDLDDYVSYSDGGGVNIDNSFTLQRSLAEFQAANALEENNNIDPLSAFGSSEDSDTTGEYGVSTTINTEELGVGNHEYMFEYRYDIPGTGNSIIIRDEKTVLITSTLEADVQVSGGDGAYQISLSVVDELGIPASNTDIRFNVFNSELRATTNNLGIASVYWTPPYLANFTGTAFVQNNNPLYEGDFSVEFTVVEKMMGVFQEMISGSGDALISAFEDITGITVPEDGIGGEIANALNVAFGTTINAAALKLVQPLHLFTGYLNRWIHPNADGDLQISEIALEFSTLNLIDMIKESPLYKNLNPAAQNILISFLDTKEFDTNFIPPIPVHHLVPFMDSNGDIEVTIPIIKKTMSYHPNDETFDFFGFELKYSDGFVTVQSFENPLYTALKAASPSIDSPLSDNGWIDIGSKLDFLDNFDGRDDNKLSLQRGDRINVLGTSFKMPISVSFGVPDVDIKIPDPLEMLVPFDYVLNGKIDLLIPNPNLFGKAIQLIQPDFEIEYGGGFDSDAKFVSILDLVSNVEGNSLNLQVPYLAVHKTPLWQIDLSNPFTENSNEIIGPMVGVGENEGATSSVPAYVFGLFGSLMDNVKNFLDDILETLIESMLNSILINIFDEYDDEIDDIAANLVDIFSNLPVSTIQSLLGKFTDFGSGVLKTSLSFDLTRFLPDIEKLIPSESINMILEVTKPITNIVDKLGPISDIIGFAFGGISSIFVKILQDVINNLVVKLQEDLLGPVIERFSANFSSLTNGLSEKMNDLINFDNINLPNYDDSQIDVPEVKPQNVGISDFQSMSTLLSGATISLNPVKVDNFLDEVEDTVEGFFTDFLQNKQTIKSIIFPILAPSAAILDFTGINLLQLIKDATNIQGSSTNYDDTKINNPSINTNNIFEQNGLPTLDKWVGFAIETTLSIFGDHFIAKIAYLEDILDDNQGSRELNQAHDLVGDRLSMDMNFASFVLEFISLLGSYISNYGFNWNEAEDSYFDQLLSPAVQASLVSHIISYFREKVDYEIKLSYIAPGTVDLNNGTSPLVPHLLSKIDEVRIKESLVFFNLRKNHYKQVISNDLYALYNNYENGGVLKGGTGGRITQLDVEFTQNRVKKWSIIQLIFWGIEKVLTFAPEEAASNNNILIDEILINGFNQLKDFFNLLIDVVGKSISDRSVFSCEVFIGHQALLGKDIQQNKIDYLNEVCEAYYDKKDNGESTIIEVTIILEFILRSIYSYITAIVKYIMNIFEIIEIFFRWGQAIRLTLTKRTLKIFYSTLVFTKLNIEYDKFNVIAVGIATTFAAPFSFLGKLKSLPIVGSLVSFINGTVFGGKAAYLFSPDFDVGSINHLDQDDGSGAIDVIEIINSALSEALWRWNIIGLFFQAIDFSSNAPYLE